MVGGAVKAPVPFSPISALFSPSGGTSALTYKKQDLPRQPILLQFLPSWPMPGASDDSRPDISCRPITRSIGVCLLVICYSQHLSFHRRTWSKSDSGLEHCLVPGEVLLLGSKKPSCVFMNRMMSGSALLQRWWSHHRTWTPDFSKPNHLSKKSSSNTITLGVGLGLEATQISIYDTLFLHIWNTLPSQ